MTEETKFVFVMSRIEVQWLYRQLKSGRDRAEAEMKSFTGPLSAEDHAKANEITKYFQELDRLTISLKDRLDLGEKEAAQARYLREDLEEAFDLVETEEGKKEVMRRLKEIPKEEPYRLSFDRNTLRFVLKLVENDLQKFRTSVIPTYEKADPKDFGDDLIQTKTYWINKAKKSKQILELLKIKLEKELA